MRSDPSCPNDTKSKELFECARSMMPGGVNSSVRAFGSVGVNPRFIREAHGSRMRDVDGNELIDYVGSWGPMVLGHAHPDVVNAVQRAASLGSSFGCPTVLENEMAEQLIEAVPSLEMVRMVNSGTEAGMAVVRLARGATGRPKIIKMAGCYHGHADSLLARAGSGVATLGLPDSPGVTSAAAADTLTVAYNDLGAVERALEENEGQVAAVLVEPVAGNMGLIPPKAGYLKGLRELTHRHGALLIFDEVMTGFRVARGGAQARFAVMPDLTMLGKIIGGGLPVGAFGGRRDLMERIAPAGSIYHAGTLSGNPLAMAAGVTTLRLLREEVYDQLEATAERLQRGLAEAAERADIPVTLNRVGSMIGMFFREGPVEDYAAVAAADQARFARWFRGMLHEGVYLPPSQFETVFVSAAHTPEDIDRTLEAARKVMGSL